jgi:hypothetical protein
MAKRVTDVAVTQTDHTAAALAAWILEARPNEVHVRHLQREVRLAGMRTAADIKKAAGALVEADWLRAPARGFGVRSRVAYPVNPGVYEA